MDKDSKKEQTKQCTIPSVSGSITVYKGRADRYRDIYSKSSWFDNSEYFVIQDVYLYTQTFVCLPAAVLPSFPYLNICSSYWST